MHAASALVYLFYWRNKFSAPTVIKLEFIYLIIIL